MNIKNYYAMTQAEVGQAMGITRQKVFEIECSAYEKIRVALEERGIRPQDLIETKNASK